MYTTLPSFLTAIGRDANAALVFNAGGPAIKPAYHVTEIKLANIRAVDCGRVESEWTETIVQLLDGPDGSVAPDAEWMSAGKFTGIAEASVDGLADPMDGELFFEFAPDHGVLQKLSVGSIEQTNEGWVVQLEPVTAVCKPMQRMSVARPGSGGCC